MSAPGPVQPGARPPDRREVSLDEGGKEGWTGAPAALARLQLELPVGGAVRCSVGAGYPEAAPPAEELVAGAGFVVESSRPTRGRWVIDARRDRTLPDFVAAGMRILVCGLNPSLIAADAGFGYAGPTNRFWSVAVAAGLTAHPRQPLAGLADDGMGMTDLVKRATPNADSLTPAEYQAGAERSPAWSNGCSPAWCSSSAWPAGGRPSTAAPSRGRNPCRSAVCPPT